MLKFYAVMENSSDGWQSGSYDPAEAVTLLHQYRNAGFWESYIEIIDEDECCLIEKWYPEDDRCDCVVKNPEAFGKKLVSLGWNYDEDYEELVFKYQIGKESMNELKRFMV